MWAMDSGAYLQEMAWPGLARTGAQADMEKHPNRVRLTALAPVGPDSQSVGAAVDPEGSIDALNILLHGVDRHVELVRDALKGVALSHQEQY